MAVNVLDRVYVAAHLGFQNHSVLRHVISRATMAVNVLDTTNASANEATRGKTVQNLYVDEGVRMAGNVCPKIDVPVLKASVEDAVKKLFADQAVNMEHVLCQMSVNVSEATTVLSVKNSNVREHVKMVVHV